MINNKSFFILGDSTYNVYDTDLILEYVNNEISLYLEVIPDDKENIDEDWSISIEFNTHVSTIEDLEDKKFVWNSQIDEFGENAGYISLYEINVKSGTIEIVSIKENKMTMKWYGVLEGPDCSTFDMVFDVKIPEKSNYVIDVYKSVKTVIDHHTQLEILNIEDFNKELIKLSKSRKRTASKLRTKLDCIFKSSKYEFNAVLKFKLTIDKKEYLGEVIFRGDTIKHVTHLDESCPRRVIFKYVSWRLQSKLEQFSFGIE
ncbi:hypothetical protein [Anaerosporobacter sp.]|uniref:hypothetical protein n=1 Tax=Anaerosporobacter sp. TaxID=1872529 RepID=UPI00286F8AB1|nr:hypothetical protein [Anaerosporobacter sp.]